MVTAFLFHRGGHDDPARLFGQCPCKSFQSAAYVLGMGFTFDDTDTKGVATPLAEMRRLIDRDSVEPGGDLPLYRWRGGEHQPNPRAFYRYVINFGGQHSSRKRAANVGGASMAIVSRRR